MFQFNNYGLNKNKNSDNLAVENQKSEKVRLKHLLSLKLHNHSKI